jgi:hypothetical protein
MPKKIPANDPLVKKMEANKRKGCTCEYYFESYSWGSEMAMLSRADCPIHGEGR